jgi:hypothetical protein
MQWLGRFQASFPNWLGLPQVALDAILTKGNPSSIIVELYKFVFNQTWSIMIRSWD